ncbi:hypothetical protein RJT34_11916 [Clitoria ternatea]|uniref:Uncharacterized protein n=1 Tax=Clitoria ternatea TaxID=43366 RepID=A0AAN9JKU6_CLITE
MLLKGGVESRPIINVERRKGRKPSKCLSFQGVQEDFTWNAGVELEVEIGSGARIKVEVGIGNEVEDDEVGFKDETGGISEHFCRNKGTRGE